MRVSDYPKTSTPATDDYLLLDGVTNGTRAIKSSTYLGNTGSVRSVAAGAGLSGGTITTTGTISLASGVVTPAAAGPTSNITGTDGTIVKLARLSVDTYGRVTNLSEYTLTNKDTWRGCVNNLTSTATAESLSANCGRLLATGSARDSTKLPLAGNAGNPMTGNIWVGGSSTTPSIAISSGGFFRYAGNLPLYAGYGSTGTFYVQALSKGGMVSKNLDDTGYTPVTASAFNTGSSERYKENIKDLTDEEALKLLEARPVTYDYKEGFVDETVRYNNSGFIAENIDSIINTTGIVAYSYDEHGDKQVESLDYARFAPYLLKLIQLQDARIKQLEEAIENMSGN